jgi:hypothetical protein
VKIRVIRGKIVMNQLLFKAQAAWNLGPVSLARYFCYQIGLRTGLNPVRRLQAIVPEGPFFAGPTQIDTDLAAPPYWIDKARYFSWMERPLHGQPPQWHHNPFNNAAVTDPGCPWWQIPDFDPELGDIKTIWEASRLDWVVAHACQARAGDTEAITRLNHWLTDWLHHNSPYHGPNWKCGQEASLRVLHLGLAALVLDCATTPCKGLLDLIQLHMQRIAPTIQYALAQNNNHGSSEAAALFIGGSWLNHLTQTPQAAGWEKAGRRWLEERVRALVAPDGSFSQHSVNYHRLLLESLSMVELWRRALDLAPFSDHWYRHAQAATKWLHMFTDAETGAAPNIGANDGARLLPLDQADYRDYRPAVQLAAVLFFSQSAYEGPGPWNERLDWLRLEPPSARLDAPTTQLFDDGGYALLTGEGVRLFVRYPRYRFRPGHADALHLDFWLDGENILRDAGSYSYAAGAPWQRYFRGCVAHNTIQFDDRDQMPRLGRFLYGAWLKTSQRSLTQTAASQTFMAAYRDWLGADHQRQVALTATSLQVTDQISGFKKKAVLRWRLLPGKWQRMGEGVGNGRVTIQITADVPIVRQEIVEGWESRYYMQREPIPVLEVEIAQPGRLETMLCWS